MSLGGVHCDSDVCVTCGDVADPMTVIKIDAERELALCEDEDGVRRSVEVALVQPVGLGDELLVHAGTAISRLETNVSSLGTEARG